MHKKSVIFWSFAFAAIGIAIFVYKLTQLNMPITADQEAEVWTVQARLSFESNRRNVKAKINVPNIMPGYIKLDEHYISGNYGLQREIKDDTKMVNWSLRKAQGEQTLYYLTTVTRSDLAPTWRAEPIYPPAPEFVEPYSVAVEKIIQDVRSQSADTASFTYQLIRQLKTANKNENVSLIKKLTRDENEYANTVMKLLAVAHIPSRKLWSVPLVESNDAQVNIFIQVHNGDEWLTFDPDSGKQGLPANHLVWNVGGEDIYSIRNGRKAELTLSVRKAYIESLKVAQHNVNDIGSIFGKLTLFTLPVQIQNTYSLLLMVPLGVLLVVFMRTVVGVHTFGTFMPILIAVAFRETQLLWGVILFTAIVFIGLLIRFYLERLRLLLIPRLAVILVVVVILMLFISLTTSQLGIERLLSVSLFPIVILAMTIERMSITWEENGAETALWQGFGSLVVACLGYILMTNSQMQYMMFVFPELLLVILSLCLWLGGYTGYRLSELIRFRDMQSAQREQK